MDQKTQATSQAREQLHGLLQRRIAAAESTESSPGHFLEINSSPGLTPLVCVIGGGAGVPSYRRLSAMLPERVVCATQLTNTGPRGALHDRIETMAALHLRILRAHQPRGPYYLCGHSLGATIAFELAQQLTAAGEVVAGVFVIDQTGPDVHLSFRDWLYWQWVAISHLKWRMRMAYVSNGIRYRLQTARWLPAGFRARRFANLRAARDQASGQRQSTHEIRRQMTDASIQALRAYRPAACSFPLVLLRARSGAPRIHADPYGGWGQIAKGRIRVYDLPGTHMQLFQEPNIRMLARIMIQVMASLDRRSEPPSFEGWPSEPSPA